MEALTSPSSCTVASSSWREKRTGLVNTLDGCFWRTRKSSNFGLISHQSSPLSPISCLPPKTQVDLVELNVQPEEEKHRPAAEAKTVRVKFQLEKECLFGQQFLMVGDDPMLGSWDPELAVPLTWSDGHVWFAELDIPLGKSIQYKFILKESTEAILWQPGPDRVFQAWETQNAIVVSNDWENAELQVIREEEPNSNSGEEKSKKKSKTRVIKSKRRIANEKRATSRSEEVLGNNGSALTTGLVSFEEEAVLVPGLPPLLEILTEEDERNHVGEKISIDDSVEVIEAKDRSLDEMQERHTSRPNKGKNEDKTTENVDQVLKKESKKTPNFAETDESCEAETEDESDILFNDLRWGQKTLQNFLTNFGLF